MVSRRNGEQVSKKINTKPAPAPLPCTHPNAFRLGAFADRSTMYHCPDCGKNVHAEEIKREVK